MGSLPRRPSSPSRNLSPSAPRPEPREIFALGGPVPRPCHAARTAVGNVTCGDRQLPPGRGGVRLLPHRSFDRAGGHPWPGLIGPAFSRLRVACPPIGSPTQRREVVQGRVSRGRTYPAAVKEQPGDGVRDWLPGVLLEPGEGRRRVDLERHPPLRDPRRWPLHRGGRQHPVRHRRHLCAHRAAAEQPGRVHDATTAKLAVVALKPGEVHCHRLPLTAGDRLRLHTAQQPGDPHFFGKIVDVINVAGVVVCPPTPAVRSTARCRPPAASR